MRLVILRHGRTAWNAQRRFQGQADPPLDEVGRSQAYEVAAIVSALRPELLISSDLQRAMQTAQIVAAASDLPVATDIRLRERDLGHWQGLTHDEVQAQYPDEFADWQAGRDISRRGGETRDQVAERALSAFADLPAVAVAVLVTHSATAMALVNSLLGIPQTVHPLGPLANCHWSELYTQVDGHEATPLWRLRGHNLGAPGTIVPLPTHEVGEQDAADADA